MGCGVGWYIGSPPPSELKKIPYPKILCYKIFWEKNGLFKKILGTLQIFTNFLKPLPSP